MASNMFIPLRLPIIYLLGIQYWKERLSFERNANAISKRSWRVEDWKCTSSKGEMALIMNKKESEKMSPLLSLHPYSHSFNLHYFPQFLFLLAVYIRVCLNYCGRGGNFWFALRWLRRGLWKLKWSDLFTPYSFLWIRIVENRFLYVHMLGYHRLFLCGMKSMLLV